MGQLYFHLFEMYSLLPFAVCKFFAKIAGLGQGLFGFAEVRVSQTS